MSDKWFFWRKNPPTHLSINLPILGRGQLPTGWPAAADDADILELGAGGGRLLLLRQPQGQVPSVDKEEDGGGQRHQRHHLAHPAHTKEQHWLDKF